MRTRIHTQEELYELVNAVAGPMGDYGDCPVAVVVTDSDGEIVYANPTAEANSSRIIPRCR